jgi:hypothetical protein
VAGAWCFALCESSRCGVYLYIYNVEVERIYADSDGRLVLGHHISIAVAKPFRVFL